MIVRKLYSLLAVLLFISCSAHGQDVFWAGFSFSGSSANKVDLIKHSADVIDRRGLPALNKVLLDAINATDTSRLNLISDDLAALDGSTSATVLAAALDRELVSVEKIGEKYKLLVEIVMQALFFDFREKQVVASYPVTLQYIDLFDASPTQEQIQTVIEGLLYGQEASAIPGLFAKALSNIALPNASLKRIQISRVTFNDSILEVLPESMDSDVFLTLLSNEFTKAFSSNTGIGLLPPAVGEAIGGAMALRFSDQKVFQLKIPETDYAIHLHVDRFVSRVIDENAAFRNLLFGAGFKVTVIEPLSGKKYFDQPLRKGATKVVPSSQENFDAWAAYYETLLSGLYVFSKAAAGDIDNKWADGQQPGGRPMNKEFSQLAELIKSCK